jgi:hypothetical protein
MAQLRLGAQALARLKPQEVRCLLLRAEGYSYREICAETGWTYTKVNRCLTEGRRAFLDRVARIESGAECERFAPLLSLLADGEASAADLATLSPHLEDCLACRGRLREYRTVPARVAALAPASVAAAGDGGGGIRGALESLLGAAQDRVAALGERAHGAVEIAGGQKAVAVAASAAAIAGGGAAGVDRLSERSADASAPAAEVQEVNREPAPPPIATAPPPPSPTAAPTPPPPPSPQPRRAETPPPPAPEREFAPEAAAAPAGPAPAPAPAEFGPSGGGGGGGGGGEFSP